MYLLCVQHMLAVVMVILVFSEGISCARVSFPFASLKYHHTAVSEQLIHGLALPYFVKHPGALGTYMTPCHSRNLLVSRTNENGMLLVYRRNTEAGRVSA